MTTLYRSPNKKGRSRGSKSSEIEIEMSLDWQRAPQLSHIVLTEYNFLEGVEPTSKHFTCLLRVNIRSLTTQTLQAKWWFIKGSVINYASKYSTHPLLLPLKYDVICEQSTRLNPKNPNIMWTNSKNVPK